MPSFRQLAPFALATLSGVLYFLGFVGFDQWYLAWVALVPLLLALRGVERGRRALALSWWMGLVTHLGGYYWIIHLLQTFAHLPLALAVLGYVLLCAFQGASLGIFGWLAWKLNRRTGLALGWTAPIALAAVELAFPLLFPSYLANSQAFIPLVTQIADLGGVLLVSALLAVVNGALAELIAARLERRRLRLGLPATAAASLAFTIAYSAIRIGQVEERDASAPTLRTAIVQANVGAGDKHVRAAEGIRRFRAMTDEAMRIPGVQLVVWPESGLNRAVSVGANLTGLVASEVRVPMIVGALRTEPGRGERRRIWNSAFSVAPGGEVTGSYDKIKLLAFGEYVPGDQIWPGIYDLLPYTSHFERGRTWAPLRVGEYALSADICYEDIIPALIRGLMGPIDEQGTRPHAMVNLTNDSWYGPVEPRIHLALAMFRAIEHRRWLIRSTATGISAFVDSAGRLVKTSGFETAETLVADVPMIRGGPTVYGVAGDVVGYAALTWSLLVLLFPRRKPAEAAGRAGNRKRDAA